MFRRDRALLLGLAGPFWLLPTMALRLLLPPPPAFAVEAGAGAPEMMRAAQGWADWFAANSPWFLLAGLAASWGTLSVYILYLDRDRPDVSAALARALRLWPRFLLLNLLTGLPLAAGILLFYLPGLWVAGRLLVTGPALVAEAPVGAGRAVARGFGLTRGSTLAVMALAAVSLGLGLIAPDPLLRLDDFLRARDGGPNPVALVIVDAGVAAVAAAAALASALIGVAAYRRLAR